MRRKYLPLLPSLAAGFALIASCAGGGGTGPSDGDSGPPNQVTIKVWNYMGTGSQVFVAVQDGSGSFTKLTASSLSARSHEIPTTYTFQVNDPSKKYGVIVVCKPSAGTPKGQASFATLDETKEIRVECGYAPNSNTLGGNLTWMDSSPGNEAATIIWGGYDNFIDADTSYSVYAHSPTNDLIAIHATGSPTQVADYIWIGRGIGSGTMNIDFNDTSKFKPVDNSTVTLDCPNSKWPSGTFEARASLNFLTSGGAKFSAGGSSRLPVTVKKFFPDSLIQPDDRFYYNFFATDSFSRSTRGSLLQLYTTSPSDKTCPDLLPIPDPASFTDPESNNRVNISFSPVTSIPSSFNEVAMYTIINYVDANWEWSFTFSSDYVGNVSSFNWEFPDLSSLSGWDSNWTPHDNPSAGKGRFWYWAVGGGTKADFRDCHLFKKKVCNNGFIAGYAFINN